MANNSEPLLINNDIQKAKNTKKQKKSGSYYQNPREDMLEFIPSGIKKTLEVGCGEGNFSALLKDRFGVEAWAVEINEESARQAEKKLHKVIIEDAHSSINKLPEKYFDCIICFDILEHLEDPYSLLTSLKSKLAIGGVIITSIPNIRYYSAFRKFVLHGNWDYMDQGIMDRTHLRFITYKSIKKMFKDLGFNTTITKGIHPTSSFTCKVLQLFTFGFFSDIKYKHFVSIVSVDEKES
ncbi:MAG: class I SAM-dependent methyltransferase [Phycisphaerae bacterium]|nr:class I SAM-dependent methyltransferase [Phycisphaerae bacterium]